MIRNIIFDIGNVLMNFDWDRYIHGLFDDETAAKVNAALWSTGYWKELDRNVLTEDEILGLFYSAGPDCKDEIFEVYSRVGECMERNDWAVPLVDELKERGYRVLYLSNFSPHVMGCNPAAYDAVTHMDGGVYSCDVKVIKPSPEIYQAIIDKYDLVPEECLFIDDHRDNIAMARKFGMKGIIFSSYEQMKSDLEQALSKSSGHDRLSVLCYGDSNTYGYDPATGGRYPADKRWTSILADLLGSRYEVIPEGLNGRTTAYDRPGAGWKNGVTSFISCLGTHKPVDYLVIMLGTNDCIDGLGLTAEEIAGGMENLVNLAEEYSPELQGYLPEIIVVSPPGVRGDMWRSEFALEFSEAAMKKSYDIEPLFRDIAERHLIRFASGTEADVVVSDCLHLSEQGHRQLAEIIYTELTRPAEHYDVEQALAP